MTAILVSPLRFEVASTSAGHVFDEPSQLSAGSQAPVDERQTPLPFTSAGQLMLDPVHDSAGSHTPPDDRWTPAG